MEPRFTKSLRPEMLVTRLGEYLVERGHITREQLNTALQYQEELRGVLDEAPLIGQVLVEMRMLTPDQLDEAVTEQIIQLRAALEENNRKLERRVVARTAELQEALDKLSELSQLKTNFVSNISHELRTPLTHIKGYLELFSSGDLGRPTPEQARALATMQRASERLERLIDDLILFATMEHNNIELRQLAFNLRPICDVAIERAQHTARQQKVNLTVEAPPDLPAVFGDSERIGWVIQQLVENAIKFTPEKGSVCVQLSSKERHVRCTVADSGIGIPVEHLEAIFEPFHQLDSSSTRRYGGTGLGLSLVRKIIEAHGSKIQVHSAPGQGSQFTFELITAAAVMEREP